MGIETGREWCRCGVRTKLNRGDQDIPESKGKATRGLGENKFGDGRRERESAWKKEEAKKGAANE